MRSWNRITLLLALSLAATAAGCETDGGSDAGDTGVAGDTGDTGVDAGTDLAQADPGESDPAPTDPGPAPADPGTVDPGRADPSPNPDDIGHYPDLPIPDMPILPPDDLPPMPDVPLPPPPWVERQPLGTVDWNVFGQPTWALKDFQFFATTCGPTPGTPDRWTSALAVLPEHRFYPDASAIGPNLPHDPPYDYDLARGMWLKGLSWKLDQPPAAFQAPSCALLMWVIVPAAAVGTTIVPPEGATSDFAQGPMIDPARTPFALTFQLSGPDGAIPTTIDSAIPALSALAGAPAGDGYSHVIAAVPVSDAVGFNPVPGAYSLRVEVRDALGDGFATTVEFRVVVEVLPETCDSVANLLADQGCREGRTCTIVYGSQWGMPVVKTGCRDVGTKANWETCAGSDECIAGTDCETANGWRGCYPFCGAGKTCPQGSSCSIQTDKTGVKLCAKPG